MRGPWEGPSELFVAPPLTVCMHAKERGCSVNMGCFVEMSYSTKAFNIAYTQTLFLTLTARGAIEVHCNGLVAQLDR